MEIASSNPDTPENRLRGQLAQLLDAAGSGRDGLIERVETVVGPVTVEVVTDRCHVIVTTADTVYAITRPADRDWEQPKVVATQ